ncbi:MAG: extracellular solute-binding protein [Spirochaetaceae bacterium]|jgi:raffinose/stachyose/melibiose transport system substrate-binding protein|nr:extracellular solute-binding protein [Spirochaetaceae bacterium]
MKKLVLGLCLTAAVAAIACSGKKQAPSGGNAGGTITLTGYMQIEPTDPQYAYWEPTLKAFAEKYPDIKVNFEYVTGEQFHDKFQAMASTGQIPDLFTCYAGARSDYILERGLVKDLRPYLTDEFKADYAETIWGPQGPKGEIYIIAPNLAVCTVVYVNPKILRQLGLTPAETLDEMIAQVPVIRGAGFEVMMFGNSAVWPGSSLLLSALVERTGGSEWFERARTGDARFTDKPFVDAVTVVKQLMDEKIFPSGVNQLNGMNAITAFAQGKSPYLLSSGWIISSIKGAAAEEDFNQFLTMPFPAISGEVSPGSSAATLGEALAMNAKLSGDKADAAWKFLSFIYGPQGMDRMMQEANAVTYKLDVSKYNLDSLTKQYISLISGQTMGYVFDAKMNGEGVNNILNPGIQAVMLGDKSPQQLAEEYEAWVSANDTNRKKR